MKTFNADEVLRLIHRMAEVNSTPLEEIRWVNDKGEEIKIEEHVIKEFKYTGLNNRDFVDCVIFGDFKDSCDDPARQAGE